MNNKMMKGVSAAIVGTMILTGCASGGAEQGSAGSSPASGQSTTAEKTDKPITLTLWTGTAFKNVEGYDSKNYGDWEKAKAEEFKKLHPNVTINVEVIPWKDIEQKVNVAVAGNNPPDILFDNTPLRLVRHGRNGQLEPLDQLIKDVKSDWKDSYLKVGTTNDKLYALTVYSYPGMMFVNKNLFDKKGLTHLLPKDRKWTWAQWEDAMKQVVDKDTYGTAFFSKSEQQDQLMQSFVMSAGAKWANDDYSQYLVNSPEGVEALTFMKKLDEQGLTAPGMANMESSDTIELFKQGKLATMYQMPVVLNDIENGKKNGSVNPSVQPYGIIPIYKEGATPKLVVTSENGYAVFKQKDEQKRKMALEFVKFLTQPENIKAISKTALAEPARKSAAYTVDNPDYVELMKEMDKLEKINLGRDVPWYSKLRQAWYPEIQAVFLNAKSPKQALDDFVKKANELASVSKK